MCDCGIFNLRYRAEGWQNTATGELSRCHRPCTELVIRRINSAEDVTLTRVAIGQNSSISHICKIINEDRTHDFFRSLHYLESENNVFEL